FSCGDTIDIVTRAAVELVVASATDDRVVTIHSAQPIIATVASNEIIGGEPSEPFDLSSSDQAARCELGAIPSRAVIKSDLIDVLLPSASECKRTPHGESFHPCRRVAHEESQLRPRLPDSHIQRRN